MSPQELLRNDPELQQYLADLKSFLSLFPPDKMNDELWNLACFVYDKKDETNWKPGERFKVYGMYKLLSGLCSSLEGIVRYFEGDGGERA